MADPPKYKADPTGQVGELPQSAPDVPSGADTTPQTAQNISDYQKLSVADKEKVLSQFASMPGWAKSQAPQWLQTAAMGYNASQGPGTPSAAATSATSSAPSDTSGTENNAAANAAKAATPGASPTGQPMFDPLAINAFYATGIAPMLQQLQTNLGSENALYTQMAQGIANKYAGSLPPGYQQAMAGTIPQMGAAQNDVIASLMGAQLSGSGLDQLMNNLNANQTAQEAAYRQLLSNPTLSSLGQAAGALPGGVPAQTNTIPAFTLPATPGSDPLATNNVLPGQ